VSALINAIVYSLLLMALLVFARAHFGGVNFVWMVLVLTSANFEFELNGIRGVVIRHFQRALTGAVVVLVFATMLHIALIGSNFLIIALLFGGLVGNPLFWKPLRVLRALPLSGTQLAATLMLLQAVGLSAMVSVWGTFQWVNHEHFLNGFTASLLLLLLGLICISNCISMFFGRKWWGLLLCTYLGLWFGYILVEELENHYGAVVPAALGALLGRVSTTFWWVSGFAAVLAAFCLTVFLLRSSKPYRASRL